MTIFKLVFAGIQAKTAITDAIDEFRRRTCVNFREKQFLDRDYVVFYPGDGWVRLSSTCYGARTYTPSVPSPPPLLRCSSNIGRRGGRQNISIGGGCESKGVVMHEMFHALGRWHEQSRPDRNLFVTVREENIKSGVLRKLATPSTPHLSNFILRRVFFIL